MITRPVLLDGAVATELQRHGVAVTAPWWTSRALLTDAHREVLRSVHEAHLAAGARVITANTFRANLRTLGRTRLDGAGQAWIVHAAVGVAAAAGNAAGARDVRLAGAVGPVEDCYRPDLVPPDDELRTEHRWLAEQLARSGVDLFLIETMNTVREARIALEQAIAVGGRAWVSFCCGADGTLLSGEDLAGAARVAERDGAEAVLVNCSTPEDTDAALRVLRDVCAGPIGAYPNIEDRTGIPAGVPVDHHLPANRTPAEFADLLANWYARYQPDILGGCCGTTPEHLAAFAARLTPAPVAAD